jgi:hypothetical protein
VLWRSGIEGGGRYRVSLYSFQPRIASKLVNSYYLDMGQGLVQCISELALAGIPQASASIETLAGGPIGV